MKILLNEKIEEKYRRIVFAYMFQNIAHLLGQLKNLPIFGGRRSACCSLGQGRLFDICTLIQNNASKLSNKRLNQVPYIKSTSRNKISKLKCYADC